MDNKIKNKIYGLKLPSFMTESNSYTREEIDAMIPKKRRNGEAILQKNIVLYLIKLQQEGKIIDYFSVPNGVKTGAKNDKFYGAELNRQGRVAGVCDLIIRLRHLTLYLELKDPETKGKQSPKQKEFEQRTNLIPNARYLCSHEQKVIENWINKHVEESL